MPPRKKWNFKNPFTAKHGGCGCDPKSTDAIEPKPISKTPSSSSATADGCTSSTTFSLVSDSSPYPLPETIATGDKIDGSLAVVKDSDDPYGDFRRSMLQMIIEKEIYSRDELHHLLRRFLELNSTSHHDVIVRAFTEICDGGGKGRFPPPWST